MFYRILITTMFRSLYHYHQGSFRGVQRIQLTAKQCKWNRAVL